MTLTNLGMVRPDGTPASLPEGVHDMSQLEELDAAAGKELEKLIASQDDIVAFYKLEFMFIDDRSLSQPYNGIVSVWRSGGALHGGGDQAVYLCPRTLDSGRPCASPIALDFVADGFSICPHCKAKTKPKDLAGQIGYRLTTQGWAEVMTRAFRRLDCRADVRIKHFGGDLRRATALEQERDRGGEALAKGRAHRVTATYPLKNILADTASAGMSTLSSRFRAFLVS